MHRLSPVATIFNLIVPTQWSSCRQCKDTLPPSKLRNPFDCKLPQREEQRTVEYAQLLSRSSTWANFRSWQSAFDAARCELSFCLISKLTPFFNFFFITESEESNYDHQRVGGTGKCDSRISQIWLQSIWKTWICHLHASLRTQMQNRPRFATRSAFGSTLDQVAHGKWPVLSYLYMAHWLSTNRPVATTKPRIGFYCSDYEFGFRCVNWGGALKLIYKICTQILCTNCSQ